MIIITIILIIIIKKIITCNYLNKYNQMPKFNYFFG